LTYNGSQFVILYCGREGSSAIIKAFAGTTIDPKQDLFYPKVSRDDIRTQVTNLAELESNRNVQRIKLSYYCSLITKPLECDAS
jgi:hypothetical protein